MNDACGPAGASQVEYMKDDDGRLWCRRVDPVVGMWVQVLESSLP